MTVHRDIAECRRAQQALRESQELLQDYLDNANDLIESLSPDGRFLYVNRKWRETLGYPEYDLARLSISETVQPEHRARFELAWRRLLAGETIANLESCLVTRDGRSVFVIGNLCPRLEGGKTVAIRAIFCDVTGRAAADPFLQKATDEVRRSVKELERSTREITLLSEMGDLLQSCQTREEVYSVISHFIPLMLPTVSGALYVFTTHRSLIESAATWGDPQTSDSISPQDCWALRRGRVHLVEDPGSPLRCRHVSRSKTAQHLCVPLMAQGEVVGLLHLQAGNEEARNSLRENAQRLAVTLADRISLALASLRLREFLLQQSIRDPLTDLFNRRYMQQSMENELRRAARHNRPLGIMMIDIDRFKNFNDTFGHHAGDLMLREFSKALTAHVRGEDVACRYGGEEFVLILPEASLEVTRQRAEEIRKGVKTLAVQNQGEGLKRLSVSIGVAAFPEHGTSAEDLIRAADQVLYKAKTEGRDRVAVAEIRDKKYRSSLPR